MKNIIGIIFSIIIPVFSLNDQMTPKLCVNCKFFKNNFLDENKFGKCSLFQKPDMDIDIDYFVTGVKKKSDLQYCSIARNYDNMCGKEGKKYVNKRDNNRRF